MPIMMVHPGWQHEPSMSTCARDLTRLGALRGARGRDQRVLETGTGVPRAPRHAGRDVDEPDVLPVVGGVLRQALRWRSGATTPS